LFQETIAVDSRRGWVIYFTPGFFSNAPHGAPDEFSTAIDGISPLVLKPKNEQERGNWGFQVTTKYLHL